MAANKGTGRSVGPADPDFVLEDYVLYNLVRATGVYSEEMASALKAYSLDMTKWRILMLLDDKSPSSVGELARRSVTKMPTLTRMLTRMEKEGLIVRTAFEDDRRVVEITMTPKAVNALRMVQSIGQRVFERAVEGINPGDLEMMTQTLQRIRENLARSPYETVDQRADFERLAEEDGEQKARAG